MQAGGGVVFSITGLEALDRKLAGFEPKVQKKIERKAVRAAARPFLAAAQARAPRRSGALARSLKIRALPRSRKNKHTVGVRVVTGEGFVKGNQFYGAFEELGAAGHKSWGRGSSPLPEKRFMRDAKAASQTEVRDVFVDTISEIVLETAREA